MFGKKKPKLFGNEIEPSCEYCIHFSVMAGQGRCVFSLSCPDCGKFQYDPLRREPKAAPPLKDYSDEDFRL